jgi:hypothetical protein
METKTRYEDKTSALVEMTLTKDDFEITTEEVEHNTSGEFQKYITPRIELHVRMTLNREINLDTVKKMLLRYGFQGNKEAGSKENPFDLHRSEDTYADMKRIRTAKGRDRQVADMIDRFSVNRQKMIDHHIEAHISRVNRALNEVAEEAERRLVDWLGAWETWNIEDEQDQAATKTADAEYQAAVDAMKAAEKNLLNTRRIAVKRELEIENIDAGIVALVEERVMQSMDRILF